MVSGFDKYAEILIFTQFWCFQEASWRVEAVCLKQEVALTRMVSLLLLLRMLPLWLLLLD
jgi:hypothetical protein